MKQFTSFLTLFFMMNAAQANVCETWMRAVNTDQKSMVMAVVSNPSALGLSVAEVFGMKISDYVSWKGEQKGCAADVYHSATVEVKILSTNFEICTESMTLHRKDDFVTGDAAANYKIADQKRTCEKATTEQVDLVNRCLATNCPYVGDNPTFPDYQDNCQCKFFDEMISHVNEQDKYDNFYDPEVLFPKPEGVNTPF